MGFLNHFKAHVQPEAPIRPAVAPEAALGAFCPHCGAEMAPFPKSKRRCPSCKELIVPRTLLDGKKALLTPQQAALLDLAKADRADERRLVERLERYGVSDRERREVEARLQQQWGIIPFRRDIAWAAANLKVAEAIARDDFAGLSNIYWNMALQLYEEGQDHFQMSQLSKKYELLGMQRGQDYLPFKVRVLGACRESRLEESRIYTVEEALEQMPIPRRDCSHHIRTGGEDGAPGWCACCYLKELDLWRT